MMALDYLASFDVKQARAKSKREVILQFLASGEVYTSLKIAAQLMACSERSAGRTLAALERDGAIKSESHYVLSRKTNIFGITNHGLVLANEFDNPYFGLGRTNSSYITHHTETQLGIPTYRDHRFRPIVTGHSGAS